MKIEKTKKWSPREPWWAGTARWARANWGSTLQFLAAKYGVSISTVRFWTDRDNFESRQTEQRRRDLQRPRNAEVWRRKAEAATGMKYTQCLKIREWCRDQARQTKRPVNELYRENGVFVPRKYDAPLVVKSESCEGNVGSKEGLNADIGSY